MAEQGISDEALEKQRRGVKRRTNIVLALCAVSLVFFFCFFYWFMNDSAENFIYLLASVILITFMAEAGAFILFWQIIANRAFNRFNENFKTRYVLRLIQEIPGFMALRYEQKSGFSWNEIRNAAVVSCGDEKQFSSEDLLTGSYEGVGFQVSDVMSRRVVKSGKSVRIETIFSGQVMCFYEFDDRKISDGYLQIFQKEFLSDIKGWTAKHKIETDNALFNSRFEVYAENEHNAYYILTPRLLERVMAFAQSIGEQTAVSFCGKKMFVAVCRSRSMFDARSDIPVSQQKKEIIRDMEILQKAKEMLVAVRN